MKEVTKEEFKAMYFKHGLAKDGWGHAYWEDFYEHPKRKGIKYLVKKPTNNLETRMMIVNDYSTNEHRLFFVAPHHEEGLFNHSGNI